MGKPRRSAPPQQNHYYQAAQQNQFNRGDFRFQTRGNNPNIFNPMASVRYYGAPGDPDYRQVTTLNPTAQAAFNSQQNVMLNRANIARDISQSRLGNLRQPLQIANLQDYGQVGNYDARRQAAEDAVYNKATSRLDPLWKERENELSIRLANQGLQAGDQAFDSAMANMLRARNDAYAGARNDAISAGRDESNNAFRQMMGKAEYDSSLRNQQISEAMQRRGWDMNEVNALLSGNQVRLPSVATAQGSMQGTNLAGFQRNAMNANIASYNAAQQQRQNWMTGLGSMARIFF